MPDPAGTVGVMWATGRRFLTPRWVLAHLLVWAGAVAMVLLGRWQLDVSDAKHFDLQNFGYSLQWWAFSAFALFLWARAIRDAVRKITPVASTGGELVLRGGANGLATVGPAELTTAGTDGQAPVVYRGYVMPQSSQRPARSDGDPLHGAYNDYLWQLALADGAAPDPGSPRVADRSDGADPEGGPASPAPGRVLPSPSD